MPSLTPVLLRFSLIQTAFQITTVMMMSVGILAAAPLAPSPELAALPLALTVLGTLAGLFPAAALMRAVGRKLGLLVGAGLGLAGLAVSVSALLAGQYLLLCAGFLLFGLHQSLLQFLRFTAMEAVPAEQRNRALSWVLVGGIPAAFLGPLIGLWGRDLFTQPFAGSYLVLVGVVALQIVVIATLSPAAAVKAEAAAPDLPARPWKERLADGPFWLALTAASFSYGLMVMLMAASPVAMHHHGHPLEASTLVLQAHVLGMYVPSFFSGWLVKRWGPRALIGAGLVLFALELVQALQGTTFWPFLVSLTLLGVAWNFLYVGGTNLLVTRYRPSEKTSVQAFNDTFVYSFATVSTFGAGAWEQGLGWNGLQVLALPFLAVILVLLLVARRA